MIRGISESIPVHISRVTLLDKFFEYDDIDGEYLLFIKFKINPPNESDSDKKNAKDAFKEFQTLFNNNHYVETYLDNNNYTKYIDKRYKPHESCKYYHMFY